MEKQFEPAPGVIFVVADKQATVAGGLSLQVREADMQTGTVISAGKMPPEYKKVNLKKGSHVAFSRATNTEIIINGQEVKVLSIYDIRAYESLPGKRWGFKAAWLKALAMATAIGAIIVWYRVHVFVKNFSLTGRVLPGGRPGADGE